MVKDNKCLGKFELTGIPPAPRGVPQIEVTFDIDANGILNVFAQDKGTGRKQSIRISNTGGLSTLEVERMRQEAQIYSDYDRKQQEVAQLRNHIDSLVYSYTSTIRDNGTLVNAELQKSATALIDEIKGIVGQVDPMPEMLRQKTDLLQQILLQIGSAVYQSGSGAAAAGSAFPGTPSSGAANLGSTTESSWTNVGNEDTFIGDDIDETVITDYEVVD
jgi:molecular chaperone DnaK